MVTADDRKDALGYSVTRHHAICKEGPIKIERVPINCSDCAHCLVKATQVGISHGDAHSRLEAPGIGHSDLLL